MKVLLARFSAKGWVIGHAGRRAFGTAAIWSVPCSRFTAAKMGVQPLHQVLHLRQRCRYHHLRDLPEGARIVAFSRKVTEVVLFS